MFYYRGLGYLVLALFVVPLIVGGSILNWGLGIDVLKTKSSWPLHSLILLGAILTFIVGWYLNRTPFEQTIYEKTGPVTVLRTRHTFYFIRMEYWGPIILALYIAFHAFRALR